MITTTKNDLLLVSQSGENTYFIGELNEDDEGFYANRISAIVQMEIGGAWELNTLANNEYTIFFEKTAENQYFIQLSNKEYFISIVEGHTLNNISIDVTNEIDEVEAIKSKFLNK